MDGKLPRRPVGNLPALTGLVLTLLLAAAGYYLLGAAGRMLGEHEFGIKETSPLLVAAFAPYPLPVSAACLAGLFLWAMLPGREARRSVVLSAGIVGLVLFCLFWVSAAGYLVHTAQMAQEYQSAQEWARTQVEAQMRQERQQQQRKPSAAPTGVE